MTLCTEKVCIYIYDVVYRESMYLHICRCIQRKCVYTYMTLYMEKVCIYIYDVVYRESM